MRTRTPRRRSVRSRSRSAPRPRTPPFPGANGPIVPAFINWDSEDVGILLDDTDLTPDSVLDYAPGVLPDGSRIAFTSAARRRSGDLRHAIATARTSAPHRTARATTPRRRSRPTARGSCSPATATATASSTRCTRTARTRYAPDHHRGQREDSRVLARWRRDWLTASDRAGNLRHLHRPPGRPSAQSGSPTDPAADYSAQLLARRRPGSRSPAPARAGCRRSM